MPEIDDDYIQLCIDEMNAIAEASRELLWEALANDWFEPQSTRPREERQAEMDRRRAQLYREHLDAAGIEIRRKG